MQQPAVAGECLPRARARPSSTRFSGIPAPNSPARVLLQPRCFVSAAEPPRAESPPGVRTAPPISEPGAAPPLVMRAQHDTAGVEAVEDEPGPVSELVAAGNQDVVGSGAIALPTGESGSVNIWASFRILDTEHVPPTRTSAGFTRYRLCTSTTAGHSWVVPKRYSDFRVLQERLVRLVLTFPHFFSPFLTFLLPTLPHFSAMLRHFSTHIVPRFNSGRRRRGRNRGHSLSKEEASAKNFRPRGDGGSSHRGAAALVRDRPKCVTGLNAPTQNPARISRSWNSNLRSLHSLYCRLDAILTVGCNHELLGEFVAQIYHHNSHDHI